MPYQPEPELWGDWNFVPLRGTGPPDAFDQRAQESDWDQRTDSDPLMVSPSNHA